MFRNLKKAGKARIQELLLMLLLIELLKIAFLELLLMLQVQHPATPIKVKDQVE